MTLEEFKNEGERINKVYGHQLKELMSLPYLFVKEVLIEEFDSLSQATTEAEILHKVQIIVFKTVEASEINLDINKIKKLTHGVLFGLFFNINDQLNELLQLEKEHLQSQPDIYLLQAGANRLNQLGEMVTLMNLANGNYFEAKRLGEEPYEDIFWLQSYSMLKNDIEKKYNEIISKKK